MVVGYQLLVVKCSAIWVSIDIISGFNFLLISF